jgi:hypothetical protein
MDSYEPTPEATEVIKGCDAADKLLNQLRQVVSSYRAGAYKNDVDYGHAGDLSNINAKLRELLEGHSHDPA